MKGENQYRIDGTYTSLGFTTEIGGTTTPITVENDKFTPAQDGYVYVSGGSGNILIALVWSGSRDSDPFESYETFSITIPTVDDENNPLPTATYGMPSVGNVYDEINFSEKTYVQRIGQYTYSVENLATVEAMGVDYWYDNTNIFYVLVEPIVYTLNSSVSGNYTANDFGTEEFVGTSVATGASLYYGNNLVDKLRNLLNIQSLGSGLTLTGSQLSAEGGGFVKEIVLSVSDLDSQNYYRFKETKPGWYRIRGDFTSSSTSWNIKAGDSGQYTNNAQWSNSFYDHDYIAYLTVPNRNSNTPTLYIFGDKNDTARIYELRFSSSSVGRRSYNPLFMDIATAITNSSNLIVTPSLIRGYCGVLTNLATTDKTNLVAAINEINSSIGNIETILQTINSGTGV